MIDPEKLKRFDEEMRKRFGARWAPPVPVPPEDRGDMAEPEPEPELTPEEKEKMIRKTVRGMIEDTRRALTGDSGDPYAGMTIAEKVALQQEQAKTRAVKMKFGRAEKEYHEPARTKPNRRENEFMLNMMIVRNALVAMGPDIRERARRAGRNTWRDIRLATVLICRIQEQLLATMPASRDDYYHSYAMHGHYELLMDGPIRNKRMVLISDKYLGALCEAAMENECCMCMLEGNEIGGCPLRQALLEVAPPKEVMDGKWRKCEYRDAAGKLILGEEVTV